ncbi:hypothetical protein ARMGADRAFT_1089271 [Armillaria gallica]|uniref:Uncharacterized protein n=1 Tax=Armillaria gallica TaxID=47427 RepID=A0A2H3CY57_ARMGA|nr:hypothetical protein ARMGADRAFT_1089271 [Armillaria gallica]
MRESPSSTMRAQPDTSSQLANISMLWSFESGLGSQLDEKLAWGMIGFEDFRHHPFLTSLMLLAADSSCSSVVPQIYELGFATFQSVFLFPLKLV